MWTTQAIETYTGFDMRPDATLTSGEIVEMSPTGNMSY